MSGEKKKTVPRAGKKGGVGGGTGGLIRQKKGGV